MKIDCKLSSEKLPSTTTEMIIPDCKRQAPFKVSSKEKVSCVLSIVSILVASAAIGIACFALTDLAKYKKLSLEKSAKQPSFSDTEEDWSDYYSYWCGTLDALANGQLISKRSISAEEVSVLSPIDQKNCECSSADVSHLKAVTEDNSNAISVLNETIRRLHFETFCSVGIKDGRIPDHAMTASSSWHQFYRAHFGRLDNTGNHKGFWHPAYLQYDWSWLQVDLGSPTRVTGVITQGRPNPNPDWITSYKILYGNSTTELESIKENDSNQTMIFPGNIDRNSKVTNRFPEPITARFFRLAVLTWHNNPSLRIEYLTC